MNFSLIREPELFNWSGNPIVYAVAVTPFRASAAVDVRVQMTLQVEVLRGAGIYQDIKTETLTPGDTGVTQIDVSSLADPYLKYHFPLLQTLASGRCDGQSKRFRLRFRPYEAGTLGAEQFSTSCIICKGGLPLDGKKDTTEWQAALAEKFLPLNTVVLYDQTQPAFASFLYLGETPITSPTLHCNYETVASISGSAHAMPFDLAQGDIFYVPIQQFAATKTRLKVLKMQIHDDVPTILQEFVFTYKEFKYFKVADLLFINSLGGIDQLRLYGELMQGGDYEQSIVNLGTNSQLNADTLPGSISETSSSMQRRYGGNTGFVRKQDEDILQALMLNKLAYQVQATGYLLPIIITKKSLPGPSSTDFLYSAQLEWSEANRHRFFAQLSQGNYTAVACPALLSFNAVQENSTTLRISWSCPSPYHQLQVIISNGTPAEDVTSYLDGAYGSELISCAGFAGSITVEGRLLCGYITDLGGTITPSLGPVSTVTLDLVANRPPVAVGDTFELAIGHTTPQLLSGNVLTNDFDPDGDPIEAVPASGFTLQGGFYNLTADGKVYYTPPSPQFAGSDSFPYQVREAGVPTSISPNQVVEINLVSGAGNEVVYAKIFYTNPIQTSGNWQNRNSDVYVKTYADALATIPKDVSLFNISFNVRKTETDKKFGNTVVSVVTTDFFKLGTGVQTLVYSGQIQRIYYNGPFEPHVVFTEFTLLPGNGYIKI